MDVAVSRLRPANSFLVVASGRELDRLFVAYFLQFKVVERMIRASKHMPIGWKPPYFRAEVSLKANQTTHLSQHETLRRVSAISKVEVYDTCAMFFEPDQIWEKPDLSKLRLVDVVGAPSSWHTNKAHFLAFPNQTGAAHWCSNPAHARELEPHEWAAKTLDVSHRLNTEELVTALEATVDIQSGHQIRQPREGDLLTRLEALSERLHYTPLPPTLNIVELGSQG